MPVFIEGNLQCERGIKGDVCAVGDAPHFVDLFNGKVVSEFVAGPLDLPATIERTTENGHNQYRIQKLSGLRIGAGGPIYSIASINGDVRIQKHQ